jgi:iron(III) transport system substrate-binding protein
MKQAAMNLRARLAVLLIASLTLPLSVHAQSTEAKLAALEKLPAQERQQKLVDGAKGEGEAVVYANMDVAAMKPLTEGFMKRFPGVKATSVHFSGAAIITRIDSESRAGKQLSDVVLSGQLGVLASLEKRIAARYRSPERDALRDGFKDKEGLWTAYMTNVMVSAYNTKLVKKEDLPRSVEELLKPRWKNKLAMDSQSYVWFGTMLQYLGEENGLRFMKRLNDQNLQHTRGRRLMTQLLTAGEAPLAPSLGTILPPTTPNENDGGEEGGS